MAPKIISPAATILGKNPGLRAKVNGVGAGWLPQYSTIPRTHVKTPNRMSAIYFPCKVYCCCPKARELTPYTFQTAV